MINIASNYFQDYSPAALPSRSSLSVPPPLRFCHSFSLNPFSGTQSFSRPLLAALMHMHYVCILCMFAAPKLVRERGVRLGAGV